MVYHRHARGPQIQPRVPAWLQTTLLLFQLLLLLSGLALLGLALWALLDPAHSFLLRLVHFSESPPLLLFAAHLMWGTALGMFLAAGVGCAGALKLERCLISGFIALLLLLLLAKMGVLLLSLLFRTRFSDEPSMAGYLANLSIHRYGRDRWVFPLMDSIQYYHKCCGGTGARDFHGDSFWFLTNTERGTRSFVPWSCCKQTQHGRAWALQPIDPLCIQYPPGSRAFNDSVHATGCGAPMAQHLDWLVLLFGLVMLPTALIDVIGILLALKCLQKVWTFYNAIALIDEL